MDLTEVEAEALFAGIMDGLVPPILIGGLLASLRTKGETVGEMTGAARAMRSRVTRVSTRRSPLIDTCGTGGDASGTFNVSTAAAFVVAAAGIPVAKHGNRAASSRCGSADVLEALGVAIDLSAEQVGRTIDETGIGFLFAPAFHPAMRHAIEARRALGVGTLFNLLGPLTNPAGARRQVIGVPHPQAVRSVAEALRRLGTEHAIVVHGLDGIDEVSVSGPTVVAAVRDDSVETFETTPADLGLETFPRSELAGGDVAMNAAILRGVLEGAGRPAQRAIVAANAGAGIFVGGGAPSLPEGISHALDLLDAGAPAAVLDSLIDLTRALAAEKTIEKPN